MEVRHFKLIKEVAEKGSLTKAKDTLFLSQSALSHQLKEIETQLGASLFHRINKKLILTGAGKIMLESAHRILAEIEKTKLSVMRYVGGDTGTVRIATQCYTCYHWLPALMIDFHKEFPEIEIEIFSDEDVETEKLILDGKLDLAVVSEKRNYEQLTYHELFQDESIALVTLEHPWAKKKYINIQDFATENLIIHSYPLESIDIFQKYLIPEGIKPKKVMQIQVIDAVIQMVKARMGIKVIAKWMIEPYLEDNRLVAIPITKKGFHRTWYAVTLKKKDPPQYLANFIDHLKCNIGGICKV